MDEFPLIGSAISTIGSIFTNKSNNKASRDMMQSQQDYNTFMMKNKYQMQAQDMAKAGINPAFAEGAPQAPLGQAPTMSPIPQQNPLVNGNDLAQGIANIGFLRAQSRHLNAQAEGKEIENANQRGMNEVYAENEGNYFVDPTTKERIPENEVDTWIYDHEGKFPDLVVHGSNGAQGRFDAKRNINAMRREIAETDLAEVKAHLEKLVTQGQISDPKILIALQNIPKATLEKLIADAKQATNHALLIAAQADNEGKKGLILDSEKLMIDLDYQIKKDSNLTQYIEKIANGNFEVKDFFKMLVATLMQISMSATIGKRI